MFIAISIKQLRVLEKLVLFVACFGFVASLGAQAPDPDYQFDFTPHGVDVGEGEPSGSAASECAPTAIAPGR